MTQQPPPPAEPGRRCRRRAAAGRPALALVLLAALLAALPGCARAQVLPLDKQALLEFKAGLTEEGGQLLASWVPQSDPCLDAWTGVRCSCADFFEAADSAKVCSQPPELPDGSRVLQLNFGDPRITEWNSLTGTIAPILANLTALRVLNFNSNHLYGALPPDLARLQSLEQLLLGGNRLTGAVPPYLGTFPGLRYVDLEGNQFSGPLPVAWCNGSWWQFDVQGNAGLCDEVPPCLRDRILSFAGTSLIDNVNGQDKGVGGYCGVDPPTCEPDMGCRILQPDPPFFTNATAVAFAFSSFRSPLGGGSVRYRWAIGTTRWSRDVLDWVDFDGRNATEAVATASGQAVTKRVYYVEWPLNQVSLSPGVPYYVTVQASNDAGQLLGTMLSSEPIVADTSPPSLPDGSAVYSGQDFTNLATQSETTVLAASWDPFQDDETGVAGYSYQVFQFVGSQQGSPGYVGEPITNKTQLDFQPSQDAFRVYVINLRLWVGGAFFMRIYARNGAGLEGFRDAPPVTIVSPSGTAGAVSVSKVVILVAVFVGAASALVALVTYWLMRESYRRHQAARKLQRGQMKNFKYLMQSLVQQVGDAEGRQLDELRALRELAFVITDLEHSTAIAAGAPRSFEKVQEMHDSLLRELIGRYNGYEINTEGDAFHVAFKDVQAGALFCMEVQYQMMELEWPREVLRLGACKEVKAPDGSLVYRGPRVRCGLHWAVEGTVVQRLHQITKHRVFTGPAFQVTRELCEAAQGGQVLLSHEGWVRLRQDMAAASFPVVEQLGQYKFDSWPAPLWVYQVTQLLGRPLHRQPAPISALDALEAGWGMSITHPPAPRGAKGHLAFVACRLALEACAAGASGGEASPAVAKRLHEVLATVAMQFGGYIFRLSESQGAYLLSFGAAVDAVRFCHSAQALLMYSQWPADCADYCGKTELAPDGKPVFKGPRVAMAVHQSAEWTAVSVPRQQAAADDVTTDYLGTAVERVQQLSEAAHGGQVIVSEKAWAAVQDQLPGQPHVVSLGSHLLELAGAPAAPPLLLMEVMPQVLARRTFPPPHTAGMVEPGYRDAPAAEEQVAFVYVNVSKPAEVLEAEQVRPAVSDDTIIRVLTAYNMGVSKATKVMRQLLRLHRGYECKEPEPGKLTLAFRHLGDALAWACSLQAELLAYPWPDQVLEWGECGAVRDPDTTNVLWRGLRVKAGISYGVPSSKAPLNTGRADYFGSVPNLAARLMAVAQPGQVLVDGRLGSIPGLQWRDDGGALLLGPECGPLEFTPLGYLQVKGLDEPKLVFQVLPAPLRGRAYDCLPATSRAHSAVMLHGTQSARQLHAGGAGGYHGGGLSARGLGGLSAMRRGMSDQHSVEGTPRQGSATSIRTPSLKRGAARGRSARGGLLGEALGEDSAVLQPYVPQHHGNAGSGDGGEARSLSVASSGGSLRGASWLGALGARVAGALHLHGRQGGGVGGLGSLGHSEMGSPRSAADLLPLTSRSGTTASRKTSRNPSRNASFTAGQPGSTAVPVPGGDAGATAAGVEMPVPRRQGSGVDGSILLPDIPGIGGSAVGSYVSDSALLGSSVHGLSSTPMAAPHHSRPHSAHNSPPLTATRLRDAADWSYPGSTLTTPTTQQAGGSQVDHWEEGLAMEAALGQETAATVTHQAPHQVPGPQPALHHTQRHHASTSGLPPRGPSFHSTRSASAGLDAAFAAAAAGGEDGGAASSAGGAAHGAPMRRAFHSSTSAPAFVAEPEASDRPSAPASTESAGNATVTPDNVSVAGSEASGSAGIPALPAWQSPARIAPVVGAAVPPLPLSRLAQSSSGRSLAEEELGLLSSTSTAAVGLHPPLPQPALGSARWMHAPGIMAVQSGGGSSSGGSSAAPSAAGGSQSAEEAPAPAGAAAAQPLAGGGASSARRPSGLAPLDLASQGLTFETYGLESPDTITPGLQYARQVAQLFVEGRRRSAPSSVASSLNDRGTAPIANPAGLPFAPSRLGQQPPAGPPPGSSNAAGGGSGDEELLGEPSLTVPPAPPARQG